MDSASNQPVELVEVTPANYSLAADLAVRPDQEQLVGSIQKSLAEAYVYKESLLRLAMCETDAIGYVLVFPHPLEEKRCVNIVRLMIDQRFQGRGLGRRLLEATVGWIKAFKLPVDLIRISTFPHNMVALNLYRSAGFEESGVEEGEVALYLNVHQ